MKIVEYQVVSGDAGKTARFSERVEELIDAGYVPYGPLTGAHTYIAQAMVKYDTHKPQDNAALVHCNEVLDNEHFGAFTAIA